ncbi:cytochrome b5 domain-containing protein [Paucilactobacillus kaifaensis]|uniref:cytochrome b5 domain-containing protein n=1 Tax=Paucilactobacillus kaifaensis TaxID=2559921 RepID=UPI0010F7B467|nr:cytochrome b5 domain-containing protein [Paucilactobacillus kaifaensis]
MDTTFTKAELAKYNGQDGAKAYVAIDGVVYDVTDIPAWAEGKHHGNTAGQDLTEVIDNQSPHKRSVLKKLPAVGKYIG